MPKLKWTKNDCNNLEKWNSTRPKKYHFGISEDKSNHIVRKTVQLTDHLQSVAKKNILDWLMC